MAEPSDTPACIPYLGAVELGGSILGDVYPRLAFSSRSTFYLPLWCLPFSSFSGLRALVRRPPACTNSVMPLASLI